LPVVVVGQATRTPALGHPVDWVAVEPVVVHLQWLEAQTRVEEVVVHHQLATRSR
jgi:hypothetical protein